MKELELAGSFLVKLIVYGGRGGISLNCLVSGAFEGGEHGGMNTQYRLVPNLP